MARNRKILLILYCVMATILCRKEGIFNDEYERFSSKRLKNNVIKTVMTSSAFHCTAWCSMTDGCLAANVIGNHDITCELTTGLSNENDIEDDSSSELIVSNYDKCATEPGYCLNGATCQRDWTSARCLCTDRFQGDQCQQCYPRFEGDECDQCSERFQGDSCQDCGPRFQGNNCQQCSERFKGDSCLECAQNYYGDNCQVSFTFKPGKRCRGSFLTTEAHDDSGYYDNRKKECADRDDCGGFTVSGGRCNSKTCTSLEDYPGQTTFLKINT